MFHAMRWIPLRDAQVGYHAGFEADTASVTTARDADTPVRTGTTHRLETRACVVVLIVIPVAAWTVALVVMFAGRPRPRVAVPRCS